VGRPAPARDLRDEPERQCHSRRLFSSRSRPALRVGFIVAPWAIMSRMLRSRPMRAQARSSNGGCRILRAAFCHARPGAAQGIARKVETLMERWNEQFGTAAEFEDPKGGIFLWVKLPAMSTR